MKSKIAALIAAILAASLTAGCSVEGVESGAMVATSGHAGASGWQAEFEKGKEKLAAGHLGLALEHFKNALSKGPNSPQVLNALAVTYERLGRHDIAELYYDRALAIAPDYSVALNNVGYGMLTRGRYEEALIYFEQALKYEKLAQAQRLIKANRQTALNKLRLARQQAERVEATKASLASGSATETPACAGRPRHSVDRAGERVFTLVTKPADTGGASRDSGAAGSRNPADCFGDTRPRVLVIKTLSAAQPALAAADEQVKPAKPEEPLPAASANAGKVASLGAQGRKLAADRAPGGRKHEADAEKLIIEVSNGAGRNRLAARVRGYLESKGLPVNYLTNAASFDNRRTTIFYKPAQRAAAERFARQLPVEVEFVPMEKHFADIRIRLGADILEFDSRVLYAANRGAPNV